MTRCSAIRLDQPALSAVGIAVTGLLLLSGCHTTQKSQAKLTPTSNDTTPHVVRTELPAKEAAVACFALAEEAAKAGNDVSAITHYLRARKLDPALPNLSGHLATAYERQGDLIRALEEYERAIGEAPKDADLRNDMGYCCYSLGNWKDAEVHYRKSIAIKSNNPRAWNNLGLTLGQQGRMTESKAAFLRAVSPAEAECNIGFILLTQGKKTEAEQSYRRALELKPNLAMARVNLGHLAEGRLLVDQKIKGDPAIQTASFAKTAINQHDPAKTQAADSEPQSVSLPVLPRRSGPN